MSVKRNQRNLFRDIEDVVCKNEPIDFYEEVDKGHGRHTRWTVNVFNALNHPQTKNWKGLKRFIHVHRYAFNTKTGKSIDSNRFYITDLSEVDAAYYQDGIRSHWEIENQLHRTKDCLHNEDNNRIRGNNAPVNISTISSMALNLHRLQNHKSITDAQAFTMANLAKVIKNYRI